jgi:hypothetical protein
LIAGWRPIRESLQHLRNLSSKAFPKSPPPQASGVMAQRIAMG